jgi:hypothetical protein
VPQQAANGVVIAATVRAFACAVKATFSLVTARSRSARDSAH